MAMDSMMEGLEKCVSGSSDIRGVTSDGVNPDESKNKMDKFRSQNGYKNVPPHFVCDFTDVEFGGDF